MGRSTIEGMTLGFFHMLPSTVPSGPDIWISLHAVDQRSDWLVTEAVECDIKFFPIKSPRNAASHQNSLTACLLLNISV